MKENDPAGCGETVQGAAEGSGREDTNSGKKDALSRFGKDKRKRITHVEKAPGRIEKKEYGSPATGERRSYNPNFTPDNKLRTGGQPTRRDNSYGSSANRGDRYGNERYGNDRYGDKTGERKPYRPSNYERDPNRPQSKQVGYGDSRNREGGYNKNKSYGAAPRPGGRYQGQGKPGFQKQGGKGPGRNAKPRFTPENYPKYPRERQQTEIRLNRYLSMSGICSRREADELITAGLVTINGAVVTELGSKVQPGDEVRYDGAIVRGENKVYIVMNKPKGYVTSLDDPYAEKTVMEILKNAVKERVYPVGRLDKNSMGVLLITNDGEMTTKLTHPSYEKKKVYQVTLDKGLAPADRDAIAAGIELDDGFIRADNIDYVNDDPREIGIEIHSGRNRIVRRIFEHFGYQVHKLDRVYFAGLTKKNLKRGAWRFLTPREVAALHSGQYE